MSNTPTDSMRASGNEQNVRVLSINEFQNEYFDYDSYVFIRSQKQFGSLINVDTGEPEKNEYIEVLYHNKQTGKDVTLADIVNMLKQRKKVVLKGDFGLGKSRCIKQVFDILTADTVNNPYTLAINLREHWGAKTGLEILQRHFIDLNLDGSNFNRNFEQPNAVYLLDGFDEIGTQSWSSDIRKMQHIREMSVCGLKDLICKVQGGVLIVGREYYFNSDEELLSCLGLNSNSTIILECHHEFTEEELLQYIQKNMTTASTEVLAELPSWLPKRPLVIQLLIKYAADIFTLSFALEDICGFWFAFLSKMCEREARIYAALNPEIIKGVLLYLGNKTRMYNSNTGPITQMDLNEAFTAVAGITPNDESAIMLQRLPSLGRVSGDSPDRQFLDTFILNGLRAEGIIQLSKSWNPTQWNVDWITPLDQTGLIILSEYIAKDDKRKDNFITIARQAANSKNKVLAADIVSAICMLDVTELDFKDICISGATFSYLNFGGKEVTRLVISDSIIEKMDLTNAKISDSIHISKCIISSAYGIASNKSLPNNFSECEIDSFEPLATTTLIKKAWLSKPQKLFIQMIRKIFYQPGSGRKEEALLRGMGESANRKLSTKILNLLMVEKIIDRHKGDEGYVYTPIRNQTNRIRIILDVLNLSVDPLWDKISSLE